SRQPQSGRAREVAERAGSRPTVVSHGNHTDGRLHSQRPREVGEALSGLTVIRRRSWQDTRWHDAQRREETAMSKTSRGSKARVKKASKPTHATRARKMPARVP